ncbi:MAG: ribosomal protein L7/L12 [Limisphaerales bacterium]
MNHWPELSPEIASRIETAMANGNKIEAIKIYREATNCGLKEAKDAVERGESLRPAGAGSSGSNWALIVIGMAVFLIVATIALLKAMK